jgi:hypothetical protein
VTACFAGKRPEDVRQCKRLEPEDLMLAERRGLDAGLYSYFGEALPRPDPLLVSRCHLVMVYTIRDGKGWLPVSASDQQCVVCS